MRLKRLGKIAAITLAFVVCTLIVAAVLIFLALPSASSLHTKLFAAGAQNAKPTTGLVTPDQKRADQSDSPAESQNNDPANLTSMTKNEQVFEAFLDERKPLSQACASLQHIQGHQMGAVNLKDFSTGFESSFTNDPTDPRIESVKPFIKFLLIQPALRELVNNVRQAKRPTDGSGLFEKAEFYSQAVRAYQELGANKERMESVLNQSYLTMMLGRAVEAHPELAQDSDVLVYCDQLEQSMNDGQITNFAGEKKSFANFLEQTKIDPKSIGFDPSYETHIKIDFDRHHLQVSGGWVDEIFQSLGRQAAASQTQKHD
jgi:hypothetical protein